MAREEKVAVVDRVSEQLTGAAATLLTDYRGLSVTELAELRAELRKVDATYEVVKNTLTRLAARQAGMDGLDEMLVGPTALVFCGEDPVGPAKALKAFAKDHEALVVKGGYLDGGVLDADAAIRLAELASKEELLATLAGMMNNALAGFARLLKAPLSDAVRLQQALVDDGGVEAKGFQPEAPAATEPEAAAEPEAEEAPAAEATEDDAPEAATDEAPADDAEATEDAPEAATDEAPEASDEAGDDASDASDDSSDSSDDSSDSADEAPAAEAEADADAETEESPEGDAEDEDA